MAQWKPPRPVGPRFANQYPYRNPWAPIYHYRPPRPRFPPTRRIYPIYWWGRGRGGRWA